MHEYFNPDPKKVPIRLKGKDKTLFKRDLYNRDNESCRICRRWVPLTINGYFDEYKCAHIFHIKPVSRGGEDTKENCVIACFLCHRAYEDGHLKINKEKLICQNQQLQVVE